MFSLTQCQLLCAQYCSAGSGGRQSHPGPLPGWGHPALPRSRRGPGPGPCAGERKAHPSPLGGGGQQVRAGAGGPVGGAADPRHRLAPHPGPHPRTQPRVHPGPGRGCGPGPGRSHRGGPAAGEGGPLWPALRICKNLRGGKVGSGGRGGGRGGVRQPGSGRHRGVQPLAAGGPARDVRLSKQF